MVTSASTSCGKLRAARRYTPSANSRLFSRTRAPTTYPALLIPFILHSDSNHIQRYHNIQSNRDFIALYHIATRPYGFLQYNDSIHQSFGGTTFFPDQNHSRTHRTPKPSQFHSRCLTGIHHRQAIHRKTQKLGCRFMAPGGTGIHREAVPQGTQNFTTLPYAAKRL
ncbi:hypothetical protein DEO72_LG2g3559 [Vigna unguiculata]|uniref:Uncharacterized protein n=1 Tax=Vigna unguiculata TaxID=3917 RepID=A0A4D6L404_VIGUN|nr:hypothetical protein DEO72_LG2g3559 [Vigna unguiculata]